MKHSDSQEAIWPLLISSARAAVSGAAASPDPKALDHVTAVDFLKVAERHRITALFAHYYATTRWPSAWVSEIQGRAYGLTRHATIQSDTLHQVHALFRQEGIRWLTFKGPCLSIQAYRNPAMRPGDDLDLIVHPDDFSRAVSCLKANRFEPEDTLSAGALAEKQRGNWGFDFRSPEHQLLVELKTDMAPRFYSVALAHRIPWQALPLVDLDGVLIPVLPPELNLVALCGHGCWHQWERLLWIVDVACLFNAPELDASRLADITRETGTTRMVAIAAALCRQLDLGHPQGLIEAKAEQLASATVERLQHPPPAFLQLMPYHLACRERVRDRFRYLFRLATGSSDSDWKMINLRKNLGFGYRLLRPGRIIYKVITAALRPMQIK